MSNRLSRESNRLSRELSRELLRETNKKPNEILVVSRCLAHLQGYTYSFARIGGERRRSIGKRDMRDSDIGLTIWTIRVTCETACDLLGESAFNRETIRETDGKFRETGSHRPASSRFFACNFFGHSDRERFRPNVLSQPTKSLVCRLLAMCNQVANWIRQAIVKILGDVSRGPSNRTFLFSLRNFCLSTAELVVFRPVIKNCTRKKFLHENRFENFLFIEISAFGRTGRVGLTVEPFSWSPPGSVLKFFKGCFLCQKLCQEKISR